MKTKTVEPGQKELEAVLRRVLPEDILSPWRPKGKCDWTPWALCVTALAWALGEEPFLGKRFQRSLLIGDAGFTGYDFWQAVLSLLKVFPDELEQQVLSSQ